MLQFLEELVGTQHSSNPGRSEVDNYTTYDNSSRSAVTVCDADLSL